jgi:hypothetical protein
MRALGNGLYEIENRNTGEKKVVTAADLPKYGLSAPQQAQQVQPQQPAQSKGLGSKLLDLFFQRTARMGQDIGASGQVGDYVQKMTGKGSQVDIANQIATAKKSGDQNLLNQLLKQSKQTSQQDIQAPQFSSDIGKSYLDRGVGVGVELGSILAPFVAGKGILAKGVLGKAGGAVSKFNPILNTGAKTGLFTGGLLGLSKPGASAEERLTGGATGAALGWGTGKILDKILGLESAGKKIQTSKYRVDNKKSPASAYSQKEAVLDIQRKYKIKGSASDKQEQAGKIYQEAISKLDNLSEKSSYKVKPETILQMAKDKLKGVLKLKGSNLDRFEVNADKLAGLVDESGVVNASNLQKLKIELMGSMAGGKNVSNQKAIDKAFSQVVDGLIKDNVKGAATQWGVMADMNQYTKGANLQGQIGSGGLNIPIIGKVGGESLQRGKDLLGRSLEGAGGIFGKLGVSPEQMSPLLQNILKGERDLVQPQIETQMTEPMSQMVAEPKPKSSFTKEKLAMAIIADPKNRTTYEAIYKYMNPNEVLGAAAQKRKAALDSAESVYNQLEQLALEAPAGVKGWATAKLGRIPGVESGAAGDLDRVTDGLAKAISGALAGEVGVATDEDIRRWKGLMPKPGDTMETRIRVLNRLKQAIAEGRELMKAEDQ